MKITVVYGGRGLIEDPTLYVLEKMQTVLEELRVQVDRINLYENRNQISTLPSRLKETNGVVLASSVEWFGIGGTMQEFLDACWLYGDKEKIATLYMMPVVLSTTSGEKDAMLHLIKAWEVLGGMPADGICAYVEDAVEFELNKSYSRVIEKKTEQLYRTVNQRLTVLPSSSAVIRTKVLKPQSIDLTPQESEQLSKFVSDDTYVKQQKEDIEELVSMFKGMLKEEDVPGGIAAKGSDVVSSVFDPLEEKEPEKKVEQAGNYGKYQEKIKEQTIPADFRARFESCFTPEAGFEGSYVITLTDKEQKIKIAVKGERLMITSVQNEEGADVMMQMESRILNRITRGEMSFQTAFMGGEMKMKGNFKSYRVLDQIFWFV